MSDERPTGERHVPVLRERSVALLAPAVLSAQEAGRRYLVTCVHDEAIWLDFEGHERVDDRLGPRYAELPGVRLVD